MILCMEGKVSAYANATGEEENVKWKMKNTPALPDENYRNAPN